MEAASNKLSVDEFPYVRPPSSGGVVEGSDSSVPSARTRPGASGLNWAKKGTDAASGATGSAGKRLFVFILGGATRLVCPWTSLIAALLIPTPTLLLYCRSEMRIVHQLSHQLGRDIVLASTSIDTPAAFIEQLRGIALDQGQDV